MSMRVLRNLALARFDVELRLASNGRTVFALPGRRGPRRRRSVASPRSAAKSSCSTRAISRAPSRAWPSRWLAAPAFSRSQADMQFTFVNDRFVRDKLLRHAVRLGFKDVLFQARQPAYVLHVALDPRRVDVNAHPAKLEIRFRDSQLVHDFVFRTVEAAFASTLEGVADVAARRARAWRRHRRAARGLARAGAAEPPRARAPRATATMRAAL